MQTLCKTYKIITKRTVIRCYQATDAPLLLASLNESIAHLQPWMPWIKNEPETLEQKIERIRKMRGDFDLGNDYVFGIFDLTEQNLIGSTGLHTRVGADAREIGYWISARYVRQGFATEVVSALTKVGFLIEKLDRIELKIDPKNKASFAIPQKLGYTLEATLKRRLQDLDGQKKDCQIWTMFQEDFEKSELKNFPLQAYDIMNEAIEL